MPSVHLNHDIQQHGVTCVPRAVVRRGPHTQLVDDPPCNLAGSVNLRTEGLLVIVSVNHGIGMLQAIEVCLAGSPKGETPPLTVLTGDFVAWLGMARRRRLEGSPIHQTGCAKGVNL